MRLDGLFKGRRADRRDAVRRPAPELQALFWDGSAKTVHPLVDISETGAAISAGVRWREGTLIRLSIRQASAADGAGVFADLWCEVVRSFSDGFAVRFAFVDTAQGVAFKRFIAVSERGGGHSAGSARSSSAGQAIVEFALVLPLLFLLIANVLNFGGMFYAWITVANAARAGAQYMMMGGSTVHGPTAPTAAQVSAIVTQDLMSLPNRASAAVQVCKNYNGTVTCAPSGGSPPADPEPGLYVLGTVDITYTYTPFINLWRWPKLGINLTLPPTTIHRQVAMRMGGF